ncbi:TPA: HK97 family phage prohead protease [Bacillus pacificus]
MEKLELRLQDPSLETNDENEMVVSGYVNKTNQWSQVLGQRNKFVERISKGAFKRAIERAKEIRFLAEHDNEKILSSTKNGSLTLREDETGLWMSAKISDTSWGRDYHTLIKDGIIENMSFGMRVTEQKWDKRNDGISERTVYDLELSEVSAVKNPAYVQSTLNARSIEVIEDVEIPQEDDKKEKTKMENRELTLEEQIELKKGHIEGLEKINDDAETQERIDALKGELRNLQAQLPVNQNDETQETETDENRDMNTEFEPGKIFVKGKLSKTIIDGSKFPLLAGQFNYFEGKSAYDSQGGGKFKKVFALDDSEGVICGNKEPVYSALSPKFAEIEFKQKRVLTSFQTSQQTMMDNGIELEEHVNEWIAMSHLRTAQSQAFGQGDKDGDSPIGEPVNLHFQSILDYNAQAPEKLINGQKITELTGVTLENINAISDEYDEGNTVTAVIVVDSPSVISGLKDESGSSLLKRENRANGSIGTVYGRHVFVQPMNDKGKLVLMNPKAYGVAVNGDSDVEKITNDTIQSLKAGVLFHGQTYMQGKVVNPYAIKIIK